MMRSARARQGGMTLLELMVALLLGMLLSLAMFSVMTSAEGRRRTLTSVNDTQQAGNYALQLMEQAVRNAGSGFTQAAPYAFGCKLYAYQSSQSNPQILPTYNATALPAPFADTSTGTAGVFRLAPVLILPNQTTPGVSGQKSDVLVVMGGAEGIGETPTTFSSFATAALLNLSNTVPFAANDIVLVAQTEPDASTGGVADCLIEQVANLTSKTLRLAGLYHVAGSQLAAFSDNSAAMGLGNVALGKPPQFQVWGVGEHNTLYSYDLLNTTNDSTRTALARADGVFEMHALYGMDKNCDGKISSDEWVKPTDSSYSLAALMAGTVQEVQNRPTSTTTRASACSSLTTANDYLQKILAIRVGLILRTNLQEKAVTTSSNAGGQTVMGTSTQSSITLFADLDAASSPPSTAVTYTRSLSDTERLYRYRTLETTIPVRNNLLLP